MLFVVASTAMRPWANFVFQAQKALVACERVQSEACTHKLFAAQKELAQFASNTSALRFFPLLREIPQLLSSQAELLFSVASMQACLVDCRELDLSKITSEAHRALSQATSALSQSKLWTVASSTSSTLASYHHALQSLHAASGPLQPLFPHMSELLGMSKPLTYRILLQNNKEIRPSGGFMGSYATLTLDKIRIKDLRVQDIYVPDGQIKGYVEEPYGIRHYLFDGAHPGWRLRDSNWHPDFPAAAQSINWFFAEGQESPADVLVAVNLSTFEKLLDLVGPITVADYDVTIDSKSIYAITQAQAEANFFPGSTQKRDFLSSLSSAFAAKLETISPARAAAVVALLASELERGEILVTTNNQLLAQSLREAGFDGSLPDIDCGEKGCTPPVMGILEANVGSTKANCCISRDFSDSLTQRGSDLVHTLSLRFTNSSLPKPEPPYHFGGGYKNYLRLVVPKDMIIETVAIDGVPLAPNQIDQEVFNRYVFWGFLHTTQGGQTSTVTLVVRVPLTGHEDDYEITLLKQPGIPDTAWNFRLENAPDTENLSLSLSQTTTISLPLQP